MSNDLERGLELRTIYWGVAITFVLMVLLAYGSQLFFDSHVVVQSDSLADKKTEYEISKIQAEISRIRSDTAGSLFWLKIFALFVTVGGAVGGFLLGLSRSSIARQRFEERKNVDEVYQSIIREIADESSIIRATAAVKLGSILKDFPVEWKVSERRRAQMFQLTKQVMAAALSIERDEKVLKTLTISLVLLKPEREALADVKGMDLSGANAEDAYWARCDFSSSDFYAANLSKVSFRKSDLSNCQFREACLKNAVLEETVCEKTNFKMVDLRGSSFEKATLKAVNFEYAKVHSVSLYGANIENVYDCYVDLSKEGDGSNLTPVKEWIESISTSNRPS